MKISIWWNAIKIFTEKFFQAWLETLRFLTFAFPSKYLYRNFSSRSQIHLILRNVVQVSGHKVTNKPIPELTQTSRERHCTFCHFHFLSRERRNKLFGKINIAFYVTFTFYKEIKVVLSLSTKDRHIALALHWRHSNFCTFAAAWLSIIWNRKSNTDWILVDWIEEIIQTQRWEWFKEDTRSYFKNMILVTWCFLLVCVWEY